MAKTSPTRRSLELLRRRGMVAEVVERWVPQAMQRKDLWTWVDIVALDPVTGWITCVQTTSASNVSARLDKIRAWPHLEAFLLRNRAVVHGWAKKGKRGERKLWACREVQVQPLTCLPGTSDLPRIEPVDTPLNRSIAL